MNNIFLQDLYGAKELCEMKIKHALEEFIIATDLRNPHQVNVVYIVEIIKEDGSLGEEINTLVEVKLEIKL